MHIVHKTSVVLLCLTYTQHTAVQFNNMTLALICVQPENNMVLMVRMTHNNMQQSTAILYFAYPQRGITVCILVNNGYINSNRTVVIFPFKTHQIRKSLTDLNLYNPGTSTFQSHIPH